MIDYAHSILDTDKHGGENGDFLIMDEGKNWRGRKGGRDREAESHSRRE